MYAKIKYSDTGRTGRAEMQYLVSPCEIDIIERSKAILDRKKNMTTRSQLEKQLSESSPLIAKINSMSSEERANFKPTLEELKMMEDELFEAINLSHEFLSQRGYSQDKINEMWIDIFRKSVKKS